MEVAKKNKNNKHQTTKLFVFSNIIHNKQTKLEYRRCEQDK